MNNSTKKERSKQLGYSDRLKIEMLYKMKFGVKEIAAQVNKSERTIYRELNIGVVELRNSDWTTRKEYSAYAAQEIYEDRQRNKGRPIKLGKDHAFAGYIEKCIGEEKMSPYAALQQIKNQGLQYETQISVRTLCNYIEWDMFLNISNKDLPNRKYKKQHRKRKTRLAHNNIMGTSIEERSKEIDSREEYGHWEGDTVCGKGRSVKFVLTERKTRFEIVLYTKEKTQKEVIKCLDKIERKMGNKNFREVFKSITLDNGCENLDYEGMERSLYTKAKRTKIYYTHPYSAYERGSNENANKLIRRFIPKGADIKDYAKDAPKIMRWMNNYPRKILGGKTPLMAEEELAKQGVFTFSKCVTF